MASSSSIIGLLCLCMLMMGIAKAQLSSSFYSTSCPNVLSTINTAVTSAVSSDNRMGASLLRLHFHDCFVNGCDASILLADNSSFTGEQNAFSNSGSLRGFSTIDNIKTQLESSCPGVVSCADILAVAARDSVVALGGDSWTVQLGRRDSTTASRSDADNNLPLGNSSLASLQSLFSNKGFSTAEMVTLSGAHTVGQARCAAFRTRIYNDANINATYATSLQANCPTSGSPGNLAPLDQSTPTSFDNAYYTNLLTQEGLLHSDQELFNGGSTDSQVTSYSSDSATFLSDFASAMVKMGNLSPLTGSSGQIRSDCTRTN
ncbi:cationic peroxidase 1-like [Apium graveolens]|uniref:cationic peroxidase 1-like n=1 Tax=Apium graveolens TaxID=4045 RepID=UPI003D7921F1